MKAPQTHVWLLEQGSPAAQDAVQPWLAERLRDPAVVPVALVWLRLMVAWMLVRMRLARVQDAVKALPGPTPEAAGVASLAAAVGRNLGRRYTCTAVLSQGHPSPAAAAAALPRGAHVVLVPLQLVADETRRRLLREARAALEPRGARLADVHGLMDDPHVLEPVARGVRQALLELPKDTGYVVLFCLTAVGAEAQERAAELRGRLTRLLRLNRADHLVTLPPFGLGKSAERAAKATLDQLQGERAVVVVPLGPLTPHADVAGPILGEIVPALRRRGVEQVVVARPAARCASLAHALVAKVRAAELAMDWPVPEDDLLDAVTAEIERQGSVALAPLPRVRS